MTHRFTGACLMVVASMWPLGAAAQNTSLSDPAAQQGIAPAAGEPNETPVPGRIERTIKWAEARFVEGDGFYPEFGGLVTGSGISVGPGYRQHLFGKSAFIEVSGAASLRRYTMLQSKIEWPRLMSNHLSLGAQVKYQDFTQINFFGLGNDVREDDQTDYRLHSVDALGFATVRPNKRLSITGRAGVLGAIDISRGTSSLHPPTEDIFGDISAPGLVRQPGYMHGDIAVEADTRNVPGRPSRGGRYRASLAAYHDRDYAQYSFRRFEAEAAQWVPVVAGTVFGIRARFDASQTADGQSVPFYLMPSLGGPNSLRGYTSYQFRDRDALMINAEYQWPMGRMLDGAAFYDAGTVAPRVGDLSLGRMHKDYGVGVRVHSKTQTFARFDVARGSDGMQAIFSVTAPLAFSKRSVMPYVP